MHWVDKSLKMTLLSAFRHPHGIIRMTTKLLWKKTLQFKFCLCWEPLLITSNQFVVWWLVIAKVNLEQWRSALTKGDWALGLGYIVMIQQKSKVRQPISTTDWLVGLHKSSRSVGADHIVVERLRGRTDRNISWTMFTERRLTRPPTLRRQNTKNLKPTRSWP